MPVLDIRISQRIHKLVALEASKDFIKIIKDDVDGVDYHKTSLDDLKDFENHSTLEINLTNVTDVLGNLIIPKRKIISEQDFEKFVYEKLCIVFSKEKVYRQYSIGGF